MIDALGSIDVADSAIAFDVDTRENQPAEGKSSMGYGHFVIKYAT